MEKTMYHRLAILLIIATFFFAMPLAAQTVPSSTASGAKTAAISPELLKQIEDSEKEWYEHLANTPVIFEFKHPEGGDVKTREDIIRMHIFDLRQKAENNRVWYEYWKQQGVFARKLVELYDNVINQAGDHKTLAKIKGMYTNRRTGINSWIKLTDDKLKNQDSYLTAIEAEKEAYETRIDALDRAKAISGKSSDPETDESGETGFAANNDKTPSPYEKHKTLLRVYKEQRESQAARALAAKSDGEMTQKLITAANIMVKAQRADIILADTELKIAANQTEFTNGDLKWKNLWKGIYKKVEVKLDKLNKVLMDKKQHIAKLKAEKSYLDALVEIKENRAASIEIQIDEEKGNVFKAIMLTAVNIVMKKGIIVLAYLIGAWIAMLIIRRIGKIIRKRIDDGDDNVMSDMEQRGETLVMVFSSIARFAVVVIVFLLLLDAVGINIGPLMGAFAIFGLAISFGSQNLVKDLVTGFFILLEHQLSISDVVTIDGITGTVEKITLRRVVLRDPAGTSHSIPNSHVGRISNQTHGWARAIVHVGVSYNDDLRKVKDVFNEVGQKMYEDPEWKEKLMEAPSFVGVTELGDSAVVVRVWVKTLPHEQWGVEREMNLRLKLAADKNGIEIPYPHSVVQLDKG